MVTFVEHQRVDRKKEPCEVMKVKSVFFPLASPSLLWCEVHRLPLSFRTIPPDLNDRGILSTQPPSLGCFSTLPGLNETDPTGPALASAARWLKDGLYLNAVVR